MAVLEALRAKRDFTAAERDLADYILQDPDTVARMGIADLAQAAYKSNATIIRLCRKIGSAGWREFRLNLAADLEKERVSTHEVNPNAPFEGKASTPHIMSNIAKLTREAVEDCYAQLDAEAIGNLARSMVRARKVIYYALGESYASTFAFATLMSKIGVECVSADQFHLKFESAFHATSRDVALFVTYSGDLLTMRSKQIEALRNRRCKIAVISSLPGIANPSTFVDYPIVLPLRENKYAKVATFYSQECIRYTLNCLYSVAFAQNYDRNLEEKELIERLDPKLVGPHTTTL